MRLKLLLALAGALCALAVVPNALAAPPVGVTGMAQDARVALAWKPAAGATSYNVYRGASATAVTDQIATGVLTPFSTDTTAANNTTYYYVVRAVIGGVESTDSLVVQVTPRARSCSTGNPTRVENCYPGDPSWALGNPTGTNGIDGYATASSINKGDSVDLKVSPDTPANYRIEIYRAGFYGDVEARLFSVVRGLSGGAQPACTTDGPTGLIDCSNWTTSATITTTPSWPSGVYFARIIREDNNADSHVVFVVRDDARHSELLYGLGFTTYQAYNSYGGKSLYDFNSSGSVTVAGTPRAVKVSFDRPYSQSRGGDHNWFFKADHPWIAWLEENGYDIAYQSDSDMERNGALVRNHRAYMLAAHDEYYSSAMRAALEQARDAGVNIFSNGANQSYWKIRFEDGPGGQDRVEVNYKSTQSGPPDPSGIPTGTWRDPAGANRPENALLGSMYVGDNTSQSFPLVVSASEGTDPIYRGTSLASQPPGGSTSIGTAIVGWEWDARVANGAEPAGVVTLAASPVSGDLIQNNGANSTPGSTVSHVVKYRAASGALVFAAGTNQWAHGIAGTLYEPTSPDLRIQQTTMNILTDMNVTPETPGPGLTVIPTPPGGGGGGQTAPSVNEKIPADGTAAVSTATTVRAIFSTDMDASTINATSFTLAPAAGGPAVAATVSYDAATRTTTLTPAATLAGGTQYRASLAGTILSSTGTALPATSWTFTTFSCPCTLFAPSAQPANQNLPTQDGRPGPGPWSYELGVQVTVDQPMQVNALRFWKTPSETGVHTGKIWNSSGTILAQAEFALETASGWQQQPLANPITLQPGQTYTVSVNANTFFSSTISGLASQVNSGPLHTVVGTNGVYGASAGTFPTSTFSNTNYYVDLRVVDPSTPVLPSVTAVSPRSLNTSVPTASVVTATFSTNMNAGTINGSTFTLTGPGGAVAGGVTYDSATKTARFTPSAQLESGTTYTATLAQSIQSTGGASLESAGVWSFTTTSNCVCTLFAPTLTPSQVDRPTQDGRIGPGPWSYEFGVRFTVDQDTKLTAFRYYRSPSETGTHIGKLWADGALVTSALYVTEFGSGWQHQALASPIVLHPGVNYTVSVNTNDFFVLTPGGLTTQVVGGAARTVVGTNGVFGSSAGVFPNQAFNNSNYFVDFQIADGTLVAPPAPVDATPRGNETGVSITSPVRVTFSRDMDAATINGTNFTLTKQGGAQAAAGVSYDATTRVATLTPNAPLEEGATYVVNLSTGIHASTGTPMANAVQWKFATPPDTTINTGPTGAVNSSNASFTFSSQAGATFECSLDGAPFASCTSPTAYTGLADGSHTFQVRARDAAGTADPTPASRTWTIDTVAPDTTITSGPSNPTTLTSATFVFASEAGVTFQCSLDGAAFAACTSPQSYTGLGLGSHTFQVRATDAAGNVDATPAAQTWTIQNPPPTVTAQAPASGSTGVAASVRPSATFSRAMDATTITSSTFTLTPSGGSPVAATVSYDSGTLTATLTPTNALTASTTYTARLTTAVKAADGQALVSAVSWSFTTAAAPTVTSVTPPNGTTGVDRNYSPTATFSTAMNAATITTSSFTLTNPSGSVIAATVTYDSVTRTATLDPISALPTRKTFTVRLETTITSSAGMPLAAAFTWSFQTGGPGIKATYPNNLGGTFMSSLAAAATPITVREISPWTPIEVEFTEPMNPATISTTSLNVVDALGAPVAGVAFYDAPANTAVFRPTTILGYGKRYTVTVAPTITAVDGTPIEAGLTWSFTLTTVGSAVGIDSGMALAWRHWTSSTDTLFLPDLFVTGGTIRTVSTPVTGTNDPQIYDDERVGAFTYVLPVLDGTYDLRLHFAETEYSGAGQRVFDVDVVQTPTAPDFRIDPFQAAGGANKAYSRTISNVKATVISGILGSITVKATAVTGLPVISGIEVIPKAPVITARTPASGATGVARTASVTATFSQSMDPTSLTTATVTMTGPGGTPVAATVTYAAATKIVTLKPNASLAATTTYTVKLDGAIAALTGLKLNNPVSWTFTTGP